mgnify:CR=1 FL=1
MDPMTSLSLDDDLVKELQTLAEREGKKPTELVRDLVRAYLERQRYLAAIDEGIRAADAGDLIDGDVLDAELAKW